MSVIAVYARLGANSLENCRSDREWLNSLYQRKIPDSEVMDIDKACDGLVWLLSKLPSPPPADVAGAGFVMRRSLAPTLRGEDGTLEQTLKAPYGPARSLSPPQVQELNAWLQSITAARLKAAYNPSAMEADDIYPNIWEEEPEAFDQYLLPYFIALQAFLSRAVNSNQHVLVFFS
jgi:hypothetical protein